MCDVLAPSTGSIETAHDRLGHQLGWRFLYTPARTLASLALACAVALVAAGCGAVSYSTSTISLPAIRLSSPAFAAGAGIPPRYTCDGADISLPLRWSGVPARANSLELTMVDLSAGGFTHWSVTGLSPRLTGLSAGQVPPGAIQARNDLGYVGYGGPCPNPGDTPHHYELTLTALAGRSPVALGTLTGLYQRH
ncbi:MAG TPA: YbhB/YbcL family Raf kinase inhibitor-like protein [Solirubrobacteraceae bacterium]|nr:YbhB/YbcL family Raf kinase inhibitor-like protein [Solirubrobacteraceae bacterium]